MVLSAVLIVASHLLAERTGFSRKLYRLPCARKGAMSLPGAVDLKSLLQLPRVPHCRERVGFLVLKAKLTTAPCRDRRS